MMTSYYERVWSLVVKDEDDNTVFVAVDPRGFSSSLKNELRKSLKMTFNVKVLSGGYESYLDISLFNLSEEARNALSDAQHKADVNFKEGKGKELEITLFGGYIFGEYGTIFNGYIKNHVVTRRGPDIVYRIMATTTAKRKLSHTFGRNTKITQIIPFLAQNMRLIPQINNEQFKDDPVYSRGYSVSGDPKLNLTRLSKAHNFNWVAHKSQLFVCKKGEPLNGNITKVSAENGMEGVPEITETGCSFTTRLNFDYEIGSRFQIDSAFYEVNFSSAYHMKISNFYTKGIYNVLNLEYSGDTHGSEWSTKVTGTISSVG